MGKHGAVNMGLGEKTASILISLKPAHKIQNTNLFEVISVIVILMSFSID